MPPGHGGARLGAGRKRKLSTELRAELEHDLNSINVYKWQAAERKVAGLNLWIRLRGLTRAENIHQKMRVAFGPWRLGAKTGHYLLRILSFQCEYRHKALQWAELWSPMVALRRPNWQLDTGNIWPFYLPPSRQPVGVSASTRLCFSGGWPALLLLTQSSHVRNRSYGTRRSKKDGKKILVVRLDREVNNRLKLLVRFLVENHCLVLTTKPVLTLPVWHLFPLAPLLWWRLWTACLVITVTPTVITFCIIRRE